jgi:hypothetical protein
VLLVVAAAVPLSGWAAAGKNAHSLVLTGLLKVEALAGSPGDGALAVAGVAAVLSLLSIVCAWRRSTAFAAVLAIAFCACASAFATSFDVQNSRNVKAAFLPAGPEWVNGEATLVAGPLSPRTSVLEQFFWNRHVDRLLLLPGTQPPDVFATAAARITSEGRIAGASGRVVLDEDGSALVPVEPLKVNGAWLLAGSPRLAAVLDGRYGDGWLAPAGRLRIFRPGTLSFTVTAPEAMTLRLMGRTVRLATSVPTHVHLCGSGSFSYAFSSHGSIGFRAVSAHASFPTWSATRARCGSGGGRIRTSVG